MALLRKGKNDNSSNCALVIRLYLQLNWGNDFIKLIKLMVLIEFNPQIIILNFIQASLNYSEKSLLNNSLNDIILAFKCSIWSLFFGIQSF